MNRGLKAGLILLVLVVAALMTWQTMRGAAPPYATFTANDDLNVRRAPHLDGEVIGELQVGDTTTIYGKPVQADGVMWGATKAALYSWVPLWTGDCVDWFEFTNGKRACLIVEPDTRYGDFALK